MKACLILLVILLSLSLAAFAQENPDPQNRKVITNQEPFFPAGEQALYTQVYYGVKYPEEAKKKFVEGEVTLSFEVLTDSTVTNAHIISGVGHGVDEEVKNFVKTLKFAPAIQNDHPVKMVVMYSFPVKAH